MTSRAQPSAVPRRALSVLGIEIRVRLSWVLMASVIGWSIATSALPKLFPGYGPETYAGLSLAVVAGLGGSVILHELAHALVARRYGLRVRRITLFLLGGMAELENEPARPFPEFAMALAGPAFSIVFALALVIASSLAHLAAQPDVVAYAFAYLATLNFVVALFNLAPAFPMDGGRILRAALWAFLKDQRRATAWAARISNALALMLIGLGLVTLFVARMSEGLWWVLIGLFLRMASRAELLELDARLAYAGHSVAEVMVRGVETVQADMTLADFVRDRLFRVRHALYPVVRGDAWVGALDPAEILRVPRRRWDETTVGDICTPAAQAPSVRAGDDAAAVLERMRRQDTPRLVVADRGGVVGLVTLQDLLQGVSLRRRFEGL